MEFWYEYPPTFMLVRGAVGFKPDSRVSTPRARKVEPSDHLERVSFVKEWGGTVGHTDMLPGPVQEAFIAAFQKDMEKPNGG